jgi:gliding motility-associated lipoprotein GldH
MKKKFTYLWVLMVLMLVSCKPSENIIYEEFQDVNVNGWNWKDSKTFEFEITDDQHYYTLLTGLRVTTQYSYSNIWLMYNIKKGKDERKDQFQMVLSDDLGKWLGDGVGNLISFQQPFLQNIKFKKGKYRIEFNQNMRDEYLPSVNNIGFQIVKGPLIL